MQVAGATVLLDIFDDARLIVLDQSKEAFFQAPVHKIGTEIVIGSRGRS